MYSRFVNWLSATRFGSWLVKHVASPLDPKIFAATNGRFTLTGKPTLPMLTLTVVGRRSNTPRSVQLAYHATGDEMLVVASAMGQARHPGWRYNLEANPDVHVQTRGERFAAHARLLSDAEKEAVWPGIRHTIPQMATYETRTDRNICVFALRRTGDPIP